MKQISTRRAIVEHGLVHAPQCAGILFKAIASPLAAFMFLSFSVRAVGVVSLALLGLSHLRLAASVREAFILLYHDAYGFASTCHVTYV